VKFRRTKWFLALLAAVLNLGGGPMAWAQALGAAAACHENTALEAAMGPAESADHCATHAVPPSEAPAPDAEAPPCCDGGSCDCAALSLLMPPFAKADRLPPMPLLVFNDPKALPTAPLDDSLRPPIR
jgi:hypothetical protein